MQTSSNYFFIGLSKGSNHEKRMVSVMRGKIFFVLASPNYAKRVVDLILVKKGRPKLVHHLEEGEEASAIKLSLDIQHIPEDQITIVIITAKGEFALQGTMSGGKRRGHQVVKTRRQWTIIRKTRG